MASSSLFSSVFGPSSSQLNARVETMRAAEAALMSFAHRFTNHSTGSGNVDPPNLAGSQNIPRQDSEKVKLDDETQQQQQQQQQQHHRLELFDTEIPRDNIPLREGISSCQVRTKQSVSDPGRLSHNEGISKDDRHLVIHGVKVTSNNYANAKKQGIVTYDNEYPLVMLHGYMNGALYFYRNLAGLSDHAFGGQVYALDMLGWGLSSRPKFQTRTLQGYENDDTHATEQVFVESLEEWRKVHRIDKMILGGHSMGGYLATAYAEKYPERIDRLILISPAGVPDERDFDVKERIRGSSFGFRLFFWNSL
jgi:Predicted hydrolases or acyltransferases (alpha/beta hydrolase superfamily)